MTGFFANFFTAQTLFGYVCPFLGCIIASAMFAAPISDLRKALLRGSFAELNPFPWTVMTGNCLGWCIYAYYKHDPFVLASNLPGLVLSIWLNCGAAKLQYLERLQAQRRDNPNHHLITQPNGSTGAYSTVTSAMGRGHATSNNRAANTSGIPPAFHDASPPLELNEDQSTIHAYNETSGLINKQFESLICTSQEVWMLRVIVVWCCILIWVGWILPDLALAHHNGSPYVLSSNHHQHTANLQANTVGLIVNLNLIFFYGAPLQSMKEVVATKNSASIHRPTMFMNWLNSTFWMLYGFSQNDPVIYVPNLLGLGLGLSQAILCGFYPVCNDPNAAMFQSERTVEEPNTRMRSTSSESIVAEQQHYTESTN